MASVQSIDRAFSLLRCLAGGPAGVTELSDRVGLPKSTVSRLLSTLESHQAVEQTSAAGPYRLGRFFDSFNSGALVEQTLRELARPHLEELMRRTGEATGLAVLNGDDTHYLAQVESPNPVRVHDWTGERIPLHVTSSGIVLLASLPVDRIERYLVRPLQSFTPSSLTSAGDLRRRLHQVQRDGVAWVVGEFEDDVNSVAAPVVNGRAEVVAAVHAHGPSYRFPGAGDSDRVEELVIEVAARISRRVQSEGS